MTSEKGSRKDKNQNIQVFVRLRPLNQREKDIKSLGVIEVANNREVVVRQSQQTSHTKKFTFDRAFGPHAKQVEVYQDVVSPLIEEVLAGYNCTVFAYGQTGTGKTHTMVGEHTGDTTWQNDPLAGIIPRALSQLFDELRLSNTEYTVRVSYLELYNEELFDLLSSSEDNSKLRIYEDVTRKGSNIVNGLEEITVYNKNEVYKIMAQGQERKRVASTLMNAQSSRSHTVFTIVVHMKENSPEGEELVKIGKLNLVDLAGSENISKAGSDCPARRERARECVNINQSLLTLGRVITALVERHPHIPYRESKLTRILQESLGGRTKTSIIATISPGHKDLEETMSTLEYAHRAKNIQNKPEINQKMTKKAILKEYAEEIDRLKRDLQAARDKNGVYLANETFTEMTLKQEVQKKEIQELILQKRAMEEERDKMSGVFGELNQQLEMKEHALTDTSRRLEEAKGELRTTSQMLKSTKIQVEEQQHLVSKQRATEEQLSSQARALLQAAAAAAGDAGRLHDTVDKRRTIESSNLQVTRTFRDQSAALRAAVTQAAGALAARLAAALGALGEAGESHSQASVQQLEQNKKMIEELVLKIGQAMAEMKSLTDLTHDELHARTSSQRDALHGDVRRRSDDVARLLEAACDVIAGAAAAAGAARGRGRGALEGFMTEWYSGSSARLASLRTIQSKFVWGLTTSLGARGDAARRRAAAREQAAGRRAGALRALADEIAEERAQIEQRLSQQLSELEAEKKETENRLLQWVEEERRIFEERIAKHVAETREEAERRAGRRRGALEEERSALEERVARRIKWHEEQLKLIEEDSEFEAAAAEQRSQSAQEQTQTVDKYDKQFDQETCAISADMESLGDSVLQIVEKAAADMEEALRAAAGGAQSGAQSAISSERAAAEKFAGDITTLLTGVVSGAKDTMDKFIVGVEATNETIIQDLHTIASTSSLLAEAEVSHRRACGGALRGAAAAGEDFRGDLARTLETQEMLEDKYLAKEYTVYQPTGATPVRAEYRFPRQLAATSPHHAILARLRAARGTQDDDCVVIDSEPETQDSDSSVSSDSAVFAAPSPPAPPPAHGREIPLAKCTSETDIYLIRKQQNGKENLERSNSTKKPSRLPAPSSLKKPLAVRNTTS